MFEYCGTTDLYFDYILGCVYIHNSHELWHQTPHLNTNRWGISKVWRTSRCCIISMTDWLQLWLGSSRLRSVVQPKTLFSWWLNKGCPSALRRLTALIHLLGWHTQAPHGLGLQETQPSRFLKVHIQSLVHERVSALFSSSLVLSRFIFSFKSRNI